MVEKNTTSDFKNEERTIAALSYVWILFIIPLLLKKNSQFSQFHAKQGLVLFLFSLVSWFPFFGQIIALIIIIVSVVAIIKTLNGEKWEIPYVYDLSKKIKL